MKYWFFLISGFLSVATLTAQQGFVPSSVDSVVKFNQVHFLKTRLDESIAALPQDIKYRNIVIKEYRKRTAEIVEQAESEKFLTDSLWTKWIYGIAAEIYRANPGLPELEIAFLTGRFESANAVSVGEGTIVINLGLLPFLENESQAAFIICHEMAHYIRNHGNHFIVEYVATMNSPEMQRQLKDIKKTKYDRNARTLELMKGFMYDRRRHGRYKESEADSVGMALLQRTRYAAQGAVSAMEILDVVDSIHWPVIPYAALFNTSEFPFKERWLAPPPANTFTAAVRDTSDGWITDSLKTHPDCKARILALQNQLTGFQAQTEHKDFLQPGIVFEALRFRSKFEVVQALHDEEAYGRCLFRALVLLQEYPDNLYLESVIAECLYQIYANQKKHTLRKVLDLPNPKFSEEYNRLLRFTNDMRLSDLGKMTYYFCQKRLAQNTEDEYASFVTTLSCWMAGNMEEFKAKKSAFTQKFSGSGRIKILEKLI